MSTNQGLIDRIMIFKRLAVDEVTQKINDAVFEGIMGDYWDEFVDFCTNILIEDAEITHVSCYIENGKLIFAY